MQNNHEAVFFISFGGPEKREDIRPFLEGLIARLPAGRQGRRIPPERIDEVAHHYEVIGGKSPINEITNRQAAALQQLLNAECGMRNAEEGIALNKSTHPHSAFRIPHSALPLPVYVGNRNWHPFLEDTLRKMADDGIKRAIGFPTAAYRCEASWERYIRAVESARSKIPAAPAISYVDPWFDHPLFIEAISARVEEALGRVQDSALRTQRDKSLSSEPGALSWLFTAHSIPTPMAHDSHYVQELETTAALVAKKFGVTHWKLAYTSRSGAPADPWLEPDVCDEIRQQASQGLQDIFVVPIGFVADHVEVLFDLDVEAREAAQKSGVSFRRAQTVGDHPLFIQMIADVIKKATTAVPT